MVEHCSKYLKNLQILLIFYPNCTFAVQIIGIAKRIIDLFPPINLSLMLTPLLNRRTWFCFLFFLLSNYLNLVDAFPLYLHCFHLYNSTTISKSRVTESFSLLFISSQGPRSILHWKVSCKFFSRWIDPHLKDAICLYCNHVLGDSHKVRVDPFDRMSVYFH